MKRSKRLVCAAVIAATCVASSAFAESKPHAKDDWDPAANAYVCGLDNYLLFEQWLAGWGQYFPYSWVQWLFEELYDCALF